MRSTRRDLGGLHAMRFRVALVLAALLTITSSTRTASAQPPPGSGGTATKARDASSADVRVANDLYKSGLGHVRDAEWNAARDAFARAYVLYPQPVILANLAAAEVHTMHIVAGVEHYRQLLKQPTGMSSEEIELVTRAMHAAEARLAYVRILVSGSRTSDRVELDGVLLSSAAIDIDYPVDPGRHVITAARADAETARAEVSLAEGESKPVRLAPRPTKVAATAPAPRPAEAAERGSLLRSPWFWIVGAVVVAGAAAAICLGAVCREDPAYSGNLGRIDLP